MLKLRNNMPNKFTGYKLGWCIAMLFVMFSMAFNVKCSDGIEKCSITLPALQSGIEKLEYMIDGQAQGSVEGKNKIEVLPGSKITFAVKFAPEGYSKNYVRDIEIKSDEGQTLRLNTYAYDENGSFVLMRVTDEEMIDPKQTYISSDYIAKSNDKLGVTGLTEDKYSVKIKAENPNINLHEAIDIKYLKDGGSYIPANFSSEENSFVIDNLTHSSASKLLFDLKEGFTDSEIYLSSGNSTIAVDKKSKTCTLPELSGDIEIQIKALEKNTYSLTFNDYTNAHFKFKIAGDEGDLRSEEVATIKYGDKIDFICMADSDEILKSNEVTINGVVAVPSNGVYSIEKASENYNIAITPKASAIYPITLEKNETRVKLLSTSGDEIQEIKAKENSSADFKLAGTDGYSKTFIMAEVYAVPTEKIQNGTYDTSSEEAKSYLILPSSSSVYTIKDITKPVTLVVDNLSLNAYSVHLPKTIIGASVSVETSDNVKQITDTKFEVKHGSDFKINVTSEKGYDLSELKVTDADESLEVIKEGNSYTYKNINGDKYLSIVGAKMSSCSVSFGTPGVIATTQNGADWSENTSSVNYKTGELKFKVKAAENCTVSPSGISLSIASGNGKLTKIAGEENLYSLSNVTSDIVINASGITCPEGKIVLKSTDKDIVFTSVDDENVILPEENSVPFGSKLDFKVVSTSGKSVDNVRLSSNSPNQLAESETVSNAYEARNGFGEMMVYAAPSGGDAEEYGDFVTLCGNVIFPQSNGKTLSPHNFVQDTRLTGLPIGNHIVFSRDKESTEVLNGMPQKEKSGTFDICTVPFNLPNISWNTEEKIVDPKLEVVFELQQIFDMQTQELETIITPTREILDGKYDEDKPVIRSLSIDPVAPQVTQKPSISSGYHLKLNKDYSEKISLPLSGHIYNVIQYLQNCYCQFFENIYANVNVALSNILPEGTERSIEAGKNTTYDKDNNRLVASIFDETESIEPAECSFTIKLTENECFRDNIVDPLRFDEENHAKLISQVISQDRTKVECTALVSPFDENIELKWKDNVIENKNLSITFDSKSSTGSIFEPSALPQEVPYAGGLEFGTSAKEGYNYWDKLKISIINGKSYELSMEEVYNDLEEIGEYYDDEWIFLGDQDDNILIKSNLDQDTIVYKIAAADEFTKPGSTIPTTYIKKTFVEGEEKWKRIDEEPPAPKGITTDLNITSIRELLGEKVTFNYVEGIKYVTADEKETEITGSVDVPYGEHYVFKVKAKEGYDISNIQVNSATVSSSNILKLTNGMYILASVKEDTSIYVTNVKKLDLSLIFNQQEGIAFKNTFGGYYNYRQNVPYNEEIVFQIELDPSYSQSTNYVVEAQFGEEEAIAFSPSKPGEKPKPYIDNNLYIIPAELVTQNIKIFVTGLERNKYKVELTKTTGVEYYNQYGTEKIPDSELTSFVSYNDAFSFSLRAEQGYDLSSIEVVAYYGSSSKTLIPSNGVYTISDITSDYKVSISGVSHTKHTVEFRTVTGVSCIDQYGSTMPSSVTIEDGNSVSFYLSFDTAYSNSASTADVTIKGTNNKVPHDSTGKYTLSDITENKIIEIINVKKNTYKARFVPAEGVIYKTAKGKEFSGDLEVEYGETLYFKISLMDAYDQSIPAVKMNGSKNLVENSGSYCLENISDNVEVTVENVNKNPEEITIENIKNVPESVTSGSDVDSVIAATNAYNSLSDEEKALVTNKQDLEHAQREAGTINHTANGITISGVDWNIKMIVTPLTDDKEQMENFATKVDRRSLLSLYDIKLVNLLTGENYEIPYGSHAQLTMPSPDLTGYKNIVIAHENSAQNMEYIDPSIVDGIAKFEISSSGLCGIAAKEIPNYSKDVSDMSISVSSLVENEDELKSLLGENLSSELGHLIDLEDENQKNGNNSSSKENSHNSSSASSNGENSFGGSLALALSSIGDDIAQSAKNIYNWATDNEFWAVLIILILGSILIGIILMVSRKKEEDEEHKK